MYILDGVVVVVATDMKNYVLHGKRLGHSQGGALLGCTAGLFEQWEASLGSARAAIHSSCTTEIEARLSAAHASHQHRLDLLQQQLNRLAQEKADMRLLTQYTKQVGAQQHKSSTREQYGPRAGGLFVLVVSC